MTTYRILILGAGELGTAITDALLVHPSYDPSTTSLTLVVRQETLTSLNTTTTSSSSPRITSLQTYRSHNGVHFVSTDLTTASAVDGNHD